MADDPPGTRTTNWIAWLLWPFWNAGERRLRAAWRLAGFIVLVALASGALRAMRLAPEGGSPIDAVPWRFVIQVSAVLLCTRLLDRQGLAALGLQPSRAWLADFGFGLLLGALLMSGIFGLQWAAGYVIVTELLETPGDAGFAAAFLRVLGALVAVGFYEEIVTRGYLMRNLAQGFASRWLRPSSALVVACALSSGLFGLGHANNPNATLVSTINVALAGGLLALPYLLTGRLALSIGLHITWNLFQGAVFGLPVSGMTLSTSALAARQVGPPAVTGGAFGPEGGLSGLAAMAAGVLLVTLWTRHRSGRVALHTPLAEARRA
ncbi:MAG TPA: CPBP family intramembrane glutamic endopeptidase [Vicinamibacteria bacterium]|nr:CPBP family intramembrane glutamic endopeptidase [Vicinamibacteria bacterium]